MLEAGCGPWAASDHRNEKCKMQNETLTGRVAVIRAATPFGGALHCQRYIFHFSLFITEIIRTWDPASAGFNTALNGGQR
jgi:hypothetical protein